MNKVKDFFKNNKLLVISLVVLMAVSAFFQEEIREYQKTVETKEMEISKLNKTIKEAELKISKLSEQMEQEVQEVIIINKDGSKKIVKNTKTKTKKESITKEESQKDTVVLKETTKKRDQSLRIKERTHKNPSKIYAYGFGSGQYSPTAITDIQARAGFGLDFQKGGLRIEGRYDTINKSGEGMIKYGWEF